MQETPIFTTFSAHPKMTAEKRGQDEVFARSFTIHKQMLSFLKSVLSLAYPSSVLKKSKCLEYCSPWPYYFCCRSCIELLMFMMIYDDDKPTNITEHQLWSQIIHPTWAVDSANLSQQQKTWDVTRWVMYGAKIDDQFSGLTYTRWCPPLWCERWWSPFHKCSIFNPHKPQPKREL